MISVAATNLDRGIPRFGAFVRRASHGRSDRLPGHRCTEGMAGLADFACFARYLVEVENQSGMDCAGRRNCGIVLGDDSLTKSRSIGGKS